MNDSNFALEGIALWLNNQPDEANRHFKDSDRFETSVQIQAGYTLITCMNSVISYEMEKIEESQTMLLKLEKLCTTEIGWMKSFRSMIFRGENDSNSRSEVDDEEESNEDFDGANSMTSLTSSTSVQQSQSNGGQLEILEKQIILADTQLCLGILTFLTQDLSGFMKGSWLLRKAWKIYHKTYNQIYEIYKSVIQDDEDQHENSSGIVRPDELPSGNNVELSTSSSSSSVSSLIEPAQSSSWTRQLLSTATNRSKSSANLKGFLSRKYDDLFGESNESENNKMLENQPETNTSTPNNVFAKKLTKSKTTSFSEMYSKRNNNTLSYNNNSIMNNFYPSKNLTKLSNYLKNDSSNNLRNNKIEPNEIKRLMGAISFGYGLFQLAVSLLPPSFFKIISFFGFEGDRKIGVTCLKYARLSNDMRSPLATLTLLWYLTVGTQVFGFEDGKSPQEELQNAIDILSESHSNYSDSALFLFFRGRIERLQSNLVKSLTSYEQAYKVSKQNEVKLLCLHEIGWCYMIELNFAKSMINFHQLGLNSKFSKSFYIYVTMILQGAIGSFDNLVKMRNDILAILLKSKQKDAQIQKFIIRRLEKMVNVDDKNEQAIMEKTYWRFLVYEMLYLWNSLGSCNQDALEMIIVDCSFVGENGKGPNEPMIGLTKLILGACHLHNRDYEAAIIAFRDCIDERNRGEFDGLHVSAFATYEMAMVLMKNEDKSHHQEAKELLQKAEQLKNYDFENRLSLRIHQALKKF